MLSYDEIFKKWQKSGESKTPGGVKIGIFRFIAVLLFGCTGLTFNYSAWGTNCSNCSAGNYVAGCHYDENDGCLQCREDHYCDGQDNTQKPCSENDSLYTKSKAGASRASQCYREIACAGQSDANPPADFNALLYNLTNNSGVHCIEFGSDDNHCFDGATSNSWTNQYHLEPISGTNQKCYFNTRDCNLFQYKEYSKRNDDSGALSASDNQNVSIVGTLNWSNNYGWSSVNETCKKTEKDVTINGHNCKGVTIEQHKYANTSYSFGQTVEETVVYYNDTQEGNNNAEKQQYFCTSCNSGYYTAGTPSNGTCPNGLSGGQSVSYRCSCSQVERGYWSAGGNICYVNDLSSLPNSCNNEVSRTACGPGQTTDGGATSEADCHYTTQTRFCDAHGCFYLSDLSWDATNGYNWNGATSTSSGQ